MATDKTPSAPVMPDVTQMSAEMLAELVTAANARIAEEAEKAAAEARRMALEQVKAGLVEMSATLKGAGEAVESGDTAVFVQSMTTLVGLAQTARSVIAPQAVRPARGGNGGSRDSAIRDQAVEVLSESKGTWFTATQISRELPVNEATGNLRSPGAITNAMEYSVRNGLGGIEAADGPRRYRIPAPVVTAPADAPAE